MDVFSILMYNRMPYSLIHIGQQPFCAPLGAYMMATEARLKASDDTGYHYILSILTFNIDYVVYIML